MADRPFLCFVHIERTGGTSLAAMLRDALPGFHTVHPWYFWANEPENCLTARELRALVRALPMLSGVGGHTLRPWIDYGAAIGRPTFTFTWLRDPHARTLSHFTYHREVKGVDWTLERFTAERRFADYQTVRLAGAPDLDAARAAVERLDFVGLQEHFDPSLLLLKRALDLERLRPLHLNRGRGSGLRFDDLTPEQQERVRDANRVDLALYAWVRDEVLPARIAAYPGDMQSDLTTFQAGDHVRSSRMRRLALGAVHRVIGRAIEAPLHYRYKNDVPWDVPRVSGHRPQDPWGWRPRKEP